MTATRATPNFSSVVGDSERGLVLKPLLEAYLFRSKFPDMFSVNFRKAGEAREPDGWFHPSTHPLWTARQLYYYLTEPGRIEPEMLTYESRMSITMGTAVHSFIETCIRDAGWMAPLEGICPACGRPHGTKKGQCDEYGVSDITLGRRGHMDGVLDIATDGLSWKAGRGVFEFKCLAPETRVSMADGSLTRADKVSENDMILGWDEDAQALAPARVKQVWDNGVVPVWTVTTREGREINTTDEHPFLTKRGWVFAKDLQPGDKIKVAYDSDWWRGRIMPNDEAWALGALVGDGCMSSVGLTFSSVDHDLVVEMSTYSQSLGCDLVKIPGSNCDYRISNRSGGYRNPMISLLRREGLWGCNSRTKFIPSAVQTGGPQAWIEFLSGYFDTDGTVVTKGSYPALNWTSVNRDLLLECQLLLGYLGVRASVMQVNSRYKGQPHVSWRLLVRDAASVVRAQQVLRLRSQRKRDALTSLAPKMAIIGHHLTAEGGWDKVASVSEGPARSTVAIEVEGGTHVTNGIVTHNTSSSSSVRSMQHNDVETFKAKWPIYHAQVQEYLMLSGYGQAIILVAHMGHPWRLVEFQIPYDVVHAMGVENRYRHVRESIAEGTVPEACCAPRSATARACPVRSACPIGRA